MMGFDDVLKSCYALVLKFNYFGDLLLALVIVLISYYADKNCQSSYFIIFIIMLSAYKF